MQARRLRYDEETLNKIRSLLLEGKSNNEICAEFVMCYPP